MRKVPVNLIKVVFVCEDCGETVGVSVPFIAECGNPVCSECDIDMWLSTDVATVYDNEQEMMGDDNG